VVNCAGVLQDSARDSTGAAHRDGPAALFAACEAAKVKRVIHFSAMGADKGALSDFSRSKMEGDAALMATSLDWVILRPSVVYGRGAYGGGALVRGLASLPVSLIPPNPGPLQPVMLDDVVETVVAFLRPRARRRLALELAGPERMSFQEVVGLYRRWIGAPAARQMRAPAWLMGLAYAAGDLAGALGWRPPVRSTARKEMVRGAAGDPGPWIKATGIRPTSLRQVLAAEPAPVQDKWFARLYLLKPLIFAVFSIFWIGTGVISLTIGWDIGVAYLRAGGMGDLSGPAVVAGALADLLIGVGIAVRRWTKPALYGAIGISLFYAVAGSAILPELWRDPLGPLWKIWPILALNLVALAILEER
jgi:uncharacterized protein YbjT (DUF2867 family)